MGQPAKTRSVSSGRAAVAMSQSPAGTPRRASRTAPPTTAASYPAAASRTSAAFTWAGSLISTSSPPVLLAYFILFAPICKDRPHPALPRRIG